MIVTTQQLIADAHEPQAGYDVCIVGAGPAGITLALELAGSDLCVCLLEAGGGSYDRATQRLYEGETLGERYPPLRDTRLGALGGSSHVWAGWCRPLDAIDFEPRPGSDACGWPFGKEELIPYYRRAQERCGLGVFEYDSAFWQARFGQSLLLGDDETVEHAMFHVRAQRFGARYRAQLEASTNIHVALNAPVARLHVTAEGRVDGVAVSAPGGVQVNIDADRYVLAAGGIENARLLLLSAGSRTQAPGNAHGLVGRYFTDHPFVDFGTLTLTGGPQALDFYFPQPLAAHPEPADNGAGRPAVRATLALNRATLEAEQLQNAAVFFHPRYASHPAFATTEVKAFLELWDKLRRKAVPDGLAPYLGRAARAPQRIAIAAACKVLRRHAPARHWRMRAMFETESQYSNRVTLDHTRDALNRPRPRVEWRLSDRDIDNMQRVMRLFDARFQRAGVGRIQLAFADNPADWRNAVEAGKHHMGTTRMHPDPRRGVVDTDGRVHGTSNLYVAGSSVFPSGGYANPTLTIVALAIRLADHLGRYSTQYAR